MPLNDSSVAPSAKPPLYLRWWGLLWGGVTLFWLPVEDVKIYFLLTLSVGWSTWLYVWAAWRGVFARWKWRLVWLGVFAGAGVFPVSFGFILLKAGLHAHGFLDFSIYQIGLLARFIPLWGVLGGLAGFMFTRFFAGE